jgi:hypothetical protein
MRRYFLSIRASLLPVAVLVALLASGCGSSDSSGDAGMTKAQFIARADAICKESRDAINQAYASFLKANAKRVSSAADEQNQVEGVVTTVLVPSFEQQVRQLRALPAPSGDEQEVAAMLDAVQHGLNGATQQPLKFAGDAKRFGEAPDLARAYGLDGCAQSWD